ncbi:MAG: hypothetical protein ACRDPQ_12455 [Nocardioidaceae bacterium]
MSNQDKRFTPVDLFGIGIATLIVGALVVGVLTVVGAATAAVVVAATVFGAIGGTVVQAAVLAWGVALGIRTAERRPKARQQPRIPKQRQPPT